MINSDRNIYLQETETRPNKYAMVVLFLTMLGMTACWIVTEIGIFRVGIWEMRIGAGIPFISSLSLLLLFFLKPSLKSNPAMKFYVLGVGIFVTLAVNVLLNFHTTLMLMYPIFLAMLYRSKKLGIIACAGSIGCTVVSPVLGYVLGTWDIPLLQELILIGTGQDIVIDPNYAPVSLISIVKILLYLVIPRLVMVVSCSALLFYVIRVGVDHVNNMVLLNKMSQRDNLTGLYNQNFFNNLLTDHNDEGQIGIIFFDINGLKEINDKYGHEYGDILIKRCACSLLEVSEENRIHPFRVGGDEFLLLIEKADENVVSEKLSQWARALEKINEENKKDTENYKGIVCSMASGYVIGPYRDFEKLVRQADSKMYENKDIMKSEAAKQLP